MSGAGRSGTLPPMKILRVLMAVAAAAFLAALVAGADWQVLQTILAFGVVPAIFEFRLWRQQVKSTATASAAPSTDSPSAPDSADAGPAGGGVPTAATPSTDASEAGAATPGATPPAFDPANPVPFGRLLIDDEAQRWLEQAIGQDDVLVLNTAAIGDRTERTGVLVRVPPTGVRLRLTPSDASDPGPSTGLADLDAAYGVTAGRPERPAMARPAARQLRGWAKRNAEVEFADGLVLICLPTVVDPGQWPALEDAGRRLHSAAAPQRG